MKIHTTAEWDRIHEETLLYRQIESNFSGYDFVKTEKSQWSEIQYYWADLSSGIELDIIDERMFLDYNQLQCHDDSQYLTSLFYLSGDHQVNHNVICPGIDGVAAEYTETKGQSYLMYLPNIEEIEQYRSGDCWKVLRLNTDLNTIRRFVPELNTLPQQLQRLIEDKNPQRFHFNVGGLTCKMQTIIQEILQHPYQDAIARMYLEGKVLELLALQLAQLTESKPDAIKVTLRPQNIDRIYQAKDILAARLQNPPSISKLARQVGLGETTLRRGFRELFDTTVVGYLTSLRMEQAELYLRDRKLSVSEIANLVGYSHLSHFSTAFKRQFGITPSECLAGKKLLLP
ncbi:MAG: AraC family transcriptional regulator [Cyanobacteria bacterium P01_G01_bin.19]